MNRKGLVGKLLLLLIVAGLVVYLILVTTGNFKFKTGKVSVDIDYENGGSKNIDTIESPEAKPTESEQELIVPVDLNDTNSSLNFTNISN